jgi:hypothetical protein
MLIFKRKSRKTMSKFKFKGIKTMLIFEYNKKGIKQGKRTIMC